MINDGNNILYRGCPIRPLMNTNTRCQGMQSILPSTLNLLLQSNPSMDSEQAAKFLSQVRTGGGLG